MTLSAYACWCSIAGAAVEALPEQVSMSTMPGVLLDQMHDDPSHADHLSVVWHLSVEVFVHQAVEPLLGEGNLPVPRCERLLHALGRPDGTIEVDIGRVRTSEEMRPAVSPQDPVEPTVLDVGHVPDETQQTQAAGRDTAGGELLRGESGAFPGEDRAQAVEEVRVCGPFMRIVG